MSEIVATVVSGEYKFYDFMMPPGYCLSNDIEVKIFVHSGNTELSVSKFVSVRNGYSFWLSSKLDAVSVPSGTWTRNDTLRVGVKGASNSSFLITIDEVVSFHSNCSPCTIFLVKSFARGVSYVDAF